MAAQDLLRNQTANGSTTGSIGLAGPCTITTEADSVFDSCYVKVLISSTDVPAKFVTTGYQFRANGSVDIQGLGTYFLEAELVDAGTSTDVSMVANQ